MILFLLLGTLALADTEAPPPPPPQGNFQQKSNHAGDDDSANQELAKELADFQKQTDQVLNQVEKVSQLPTALSPEQLATMKGKALKLANDDRFTSAAEALWKNDRRNTMLAVQALWFLFMLIFKAWRQGRTQHWFKRLLVGFACSVLTWIGMLYVIPLAVLGEPFLVFTNTLWRVLVMGG